MWRHEVKASCLFLLSVTDDENHQNNLHTKLFEGRLSEKRNIINRQRLWLIHVVVKNKCRFFCFSFLRIRFFASASQKKRNCCDFNYIFRKNFSRKRRKNSFRLYFSSPLPCRPRQSAKKQMDADVRIVFWMTLKEIWERFWAKISHKRDKTKNTLAVKFHRFFRWFPREIHWRDKWNIQWGNWNSCGNRKLAHSEKFSLFFLYLLPPSLL